MLRILSTVFLALCLVSCQRHAERQAVRAQTQLDEATLLMDARMYREAEQKATDALEIMQPLFEDFPDEPNYRILWVRAHVTRFMARNAVLISRAEPRPRSLVRFPRPDEYVGYDEDLVPAKAELARLVASNQTLLFDQQAFVHGTLASILRLNEQTLDDADQEYGKAIDIYRQWESQLRAERTTVGSHRLQLLRIGNEIRSLQQARAEVQLLAENWTAALEHLEDMMAGKDLQFFPVQFKLAEEQIAYWENRLRTDEEAGLTWREGRITQAVERGKDIRRGKRDELGGRNPNQVELLQQRLLRAEKQNNLMYRIICYWNLGMSAELAEAREALRSFYPELESDLMSQLESSR